MLAHSPTRGYAVQQRSGGQNEEANIKNPRKAKAARKKAKKKRGEAEAYDFAAVEWGDAGGGVAVEEVRVFTNRRRAAAGIFVDHRDKTERSAAALLDLHIINPRCPRHHLVDH